MSHPGGRKEGRKEGKKDLSLSLSIQLYSELNARTKAAREGLPVSEPKQPRVSQVRSWTRKEKRGKNKRRPFENGEEP
jgi:hypothetical protein